MDPILQMFNSLRKSFSISPNLDYDLLCKMHREEKYQSLFEELKKHYGIFQEMKLKVTAKKLSEVFPSCRPGQQVITTIRESGALPEATIFVTKSLLQGETDRLLHELSFELSAFCLYVLKHPYNKEPKAIEILCLMKGAREFFVRGRSPVKKGSPLDILLDFDIELGNRLSDQEMQIILCWLMQPA